MTQRRTFGLCTPRFGLHVKACGHTANQNCFDRHFSSLKRCNNKFLSFLSLFYDGSLPHLPVFVFLGTGGIIHVLTHRRLVTIFLSLNKRANYTVLFSSLRESSSVRCVVDCATPFCPLDMSSLYQWFWKYSKKLLNPWPRSQLQITWSLSHTRPEMTAQAWSRKSSSSLDQVESREGYQPASLYLRLFPL